jgi:arylsulfatase A-like enzyme
MPTFAALAGVADKVPSDRIIDGVDQRDLLNGKSDRGSRDTFRYYDGNELQAIRIGDWKLRLPGLKNLRKWPELDRGTQETELYNVVTDISESHNVAADQPERVKEMLTFARSLQ